MLYTALAIVWSILTGHATVHTYPSHPGGPVQGIYVQTDPDKCLGFDFIEVGPFGNEYGMNRGDCS